VSWTQGWYYSSLKHRNVEIYIVLTNNRSVQQSIVNQASIDISNHLNCIHNTFN